MAQFIPLPPWHWSGCFQSQAGVPRVKGFSKSLIYLEPQGWWERSSFMCRPYAHSLTPLPAGPFQGQPAPLLPSGQSTSSPAHSWCWEAGAGWGKKPARSLTASTPTGCRARHSPASASSLTQKTVYISLHFQGYRGKEKCQKAPFFWDESLLYMFSSSKQTQPTPCFERPKV